MSREGIDPCCPNRLNLPSGRKIKPMFCDGLISRAVAFEDLLANGEGFAKRLIAGFAEELRPWPELVHIATGWRDLWSSPIRRNCTCLRPQ